MLFSLALAPLMIAAAHAAATRDYHSYAEPSLVKVTHIDLDLDVVFPRKVLSGTAILSVERSSATAPLTLDARQLTIKGVAASDGGPFAPVPYHVGAEDPILGAPLVVRAPAAATRVKIEYETSPDAAAIQWLEPSQTSGRAFPYLLTQSEPILGRSWIPMQDSPAVRVTYRAKIRVPKGLVAVMSAAGNFQDAKPAESAFEMKRPIPPYLISLAAGDLAFKAVGKNTGVYSEPSVVETAAKEFEDLDKFIAAAESLLGPYDWDRYDVLVLPPSFPYGGMENPRLTFATPTVLAGDKSLVSVVAHELAHSWAGNRVTNATWPDLWLNEGFTTYFERRIIESVYGKKQADMEWILGRQVLDKELAELPPSDQILHMDLKGRDPDDGSTKVPYEKGSLFLRRLEDVFGRERFDRYLKGYFERYAFQSITTEESMRYLKENLLDKDPKAAAQVSVEDWVYKPGLPADASRLSSDAFAAVEKASTRWQKGESTADALKAQAAKWSYHEKHHFLLSLPEDIGAAKLAELDARFGFTDSGNAELVSEWLRLAVHNGYQRADVRLESFLTTVGRVKLLKPLYKELARTPAGKKRALALFAKAKPGYHPFAISSLNKVLN